MHLRFTFVVYSYGLNSYFIFHNKQSIPTQGYMLNVYVLVRFQLGLLYPLVAIDIYIYIYIYILINDFFQLLDVLQASLLNVY
jgi:hypothetical protein